MQPKKSKIPIALAFSDLEIADYKPFSKDHSRLSNTIAVMRDIFYISREHGKIPVLFAGDLFDNPKFIDQHSLAYFLSVFKNCYENEKVPFLAISGNHDQSEKNTEGHTSPDWIDAFRPVFNYLHHVSITPYFDSYKFVRGLMVWGIDYKTNNDGFLEDLIIRRKEAENSNSNCKVLLIHTDLPGAEDPSGYQAKDFGKLPKAWKKYFKAFDLVLSGHIHKPKQIWKNTYMLGAPLHKRTSDEGCEMGYWEIYADATVKFRPLNFPKFITLKHGQTKPDEDNYYLATEEAQLAEGAYDPAEELRFASTLPKVQLAKRYLKTKGITSKLKRQTLIKTLIKTEE